MPELHLLRAEHAAALLDFEQANREWFAASISDRGDAFFEHFADGFDALLADQEAGGVACYLRTDDAGAVLGRFNLYLLDGRTADVGYRVAEHAAGAGLATAALQELCRLAVTEHGLSRLRAATSLANIASQRVLTNNGFVPVGPADPAEIGGKQGTWYERDLRPLAGSLPGS